MRICLIDLKDSVSQHSVWRLSNSKRLSAPHGETLSHLPGKGYCCNNCVKGGWGEEPPLAHAPA